MVEHKEEDLVLLYEELPSFIDEEDNEIFHFLEGKRLAFEPIVELKGFLRKEGKSDQVLQQEIFHNMVEKETLPRFPQVRGTSCSHEPSHTLEG